METPNASRPHKLSLDEFQEKIQQHLSEVLQAEVKQEELLSVEPLFEGLPLSTEEKTKNLKNKEQKIIQKLYGDYVDDTNVELPSFLKRNYQLNWKKKIVGFVAELLSLYSRETINAFLPDFAKVCEEHEEEIKEEINVGSDQYKELIIKFLQLMPRTKWDRFITRMLSPLQSTDSTSLATHPSFRGQFVQGRFDLKAYFMRELEYYHKMYKEYYSPYVAVCQSSGCGKTRLVLEMSASYELIYICTRKAVSSGQPPRTAIIADFIEGKGPIANVSSSSSSEVRKTEKISTLKDWVALLLAIFVTSLHKLDDYEKDVDLPDIAEIPFKSFIAPNISPSLTSKVVDSPGKTLALQPSSQMVFFHLVIKLYGEYLKELPNTAAEIELKEAVDSIIPTILKGMSDPPRKDKLTFLLAIDEAREIFIDDSGRMDESYANFRRALKIIPQTTFPFLCLLLDTNSKITNFVPPAHWDPSHRIVSGSSKLIPPFITFPIEVKDILPAEIAQYPSKPVTIKISDRISSTAVFDPAQMVLLSRPLFPSKLASLFPSQGSFEDLDVACNETVDLAVGKLLTVGLSLLLSDVNLKDLPLQLFAVAACRYYLATTVSSINEVLVQQHMAIVSTISDHLVVANYPSEPILSEASIQITMREDIFNRMLMELGRYITDGTVLTNCEKGELGELTACILLSRCYDMASNRMRFQHPTSSEAIQKLQANISWVYTRPIPVMVFISQLFAADHAAEIFKGIHKNYDLTFLEAVCQFSHFVKVNFQPKMNDLREYLKAAA
eukprot:gene14941-16631_t